MSDRAASNAVSRALAVAAGLFLSCIACAAKDPAPVAAPQELKYWELPTGSQIAYLQFPAGRQEHAWPIVFLHGGPGAYAVSLEPTTRVLAELSRDGYDVYVYDQVGGGLSERLADIGEYTVARHVADLESIRRLIGAGKMILIGQSWGAQLAARYIASYPDRVHKVIFVSPGALHPAEWQETGYGRIDERLTKDEKDGMNALTNDPQLARALALLPTDRRAARNAFPDAAGDPLFDRIVDRFFMPHLGCDGPSTESLPGGYGFWSNRMTSHDLHGSQSPRAALEQVNLPALVLRGDCEYMKRAVAEQYRDVVTGSRLVDIPGAGHMMLWDQPGRFLAAVRTFLRE